MLTVLLVLLAVTLVIFAGEAVRVQCRRMLARPVILGAPVRATSDATA